MQANLHVIRKVIPFVGEASDVFRVIELPHVEKGMKLWGVRSVPDGCDVSEDVVTEVGWHVAEPNLVLGGLGH